MRRKKPEQLAWAIWIGGAVLTLVVLGIFLLFRGGDPDSPNTFPEPASSSPRQPTRTASNAGPAPNGGPVSEQKPSTSELANGSQPNTPPSVPPTTTQPHVDKPIIYEAPKQPTPPPFRAPLTKEEARNFGLRRLDGKHLVLYTDLPPSPAVDELPKVFDLATPLWCKYFDVPVEEVEGWRLAGSLIVDKARFRRAGLLPNSLPPFLNGFQLGQQLWLYEQPTDFYRRHLLLHEGVHGFMNWRYGGCGPPWFMEGMAELLGTHRWQDGKLEIGYSPKSKDEAPHWSRVRIIRDDYAAGRGLSLNEVMAYGPRAHLRVEPYGWSWAAANFFHNHPSYRGALPKASRNGADASPRFNRKFTNETIKKPNRLKLDWEVYINKMEYGYDVAREAIQFADSKPLPVGGAEVTVGSENGWQSSGFELTKGQRYRIAASGRFQIAVDEQPWMSEPNGVTVEYYRDFPLGCLLFAVADAKSSSSRESMLVQPKRVGLELEFEASQSGELFFILNDSPSQRHDNRGEATVRIQPAP